MIICLAQIHSEPGAISANLKKHQKCIEEAGKLNADVTAFPEMSLTGYVLTTAKELAFHNYFPKASGDHQIPVFMVNAVGSAEGFRCAGQSAIWNSDGTCIIKAKEECESLLVVDTKAEDVQSISLG